ncbi:MAG: DUF6464 family protein [Cyanobacteriota bacterium]|nr:DUF6464 family protein [Cyanobacteriota bacterium]
MQIELRLSGSDRLIDRLEVTELADVPQPGRWIIAGSRSFLVLQRSHRYHYRGGQYQLVTVALQVKAQDRPADARRWRQQWVIGDPDCRYNARSPLLRCAVLPDGPCERCAHYEPIGPAPANGR